MAMEYNKTPLFAGKRRGALCFIIKIYFFGAGRTLILIKIVSKFKTKLIILGAQVSALIVPNFLCFTCRTQGFLNGQ